MSHGLSLDILFIVTDYLPSIVDEEFELFLASSIALEIYTATFCCIVVDAMLCSAEWASYPFAFCWYTIH